MSEMIILDKNGRNNCLYTSWTSKLSCGWEIAETYDLEWRPPCECRLVVTAQHYQAPEVPLLIRCMAEGIPVLVIADGILEYRNTWLRPDTPNGCIFQPVVGHKIAVIGRSQARILESWGNAGRCEVVGVPRFDGLLNRKARTRSSSTSFRILVMTAKTPGFTKDQLGEVVAGLGSLKRWFALNPLLDGVKVEPVWRVAVTMAEQLGICTDTTTELAELLSDVDAVISTPSTAMLEAMLLGLPVAKLDFGNYPQYLTNAWNITHADHLTTTIREFLHPPEAKMLFQDTMLHDALECRSPAASRMVYLVEEMVRRGRERVGSLLNQILPFTGVANEVEERFDRAALYPADPVFVTSSTVLLQTEVNSLKSKLLSLEEEYASCKRLIESNSLFGRIMANLCWTGIDKHSFFFRSKS